MKTMMEMLIGRLRSIQADPDRAAAYQKLKALSGYTKRIQQMEPDMRKTYSIQLKINFDDDSRHDIAMEMMREAAKMVLTRATLIADNRKPQVVLQSEDYFEGITEPALVTDAEREEAGG